MSGSLLLRVVLAWHCFGGIAQAQTAEAPPYITSIKSNVVRIEAAGQSGFGFVVGVGDRTVLVATAFHVVKNAPGEDEVELCFQLAGETCVRGSIAYVADAVGSRPALDLAIVAASYPHGLAWRADVYAPHRRAGTPVWYIGRAGTWYTPPSPGRITAFDAQQQLLKYQGLEVAGGVSGAPIISADGIVAMHIQSVGLGGEAHGVDIEAIRSRVLDDMQARWLLVPVTTCEASKLPAKILRGRRIVVHFDATKPDLALAAVAQLNCLGMGTLALPHWPNETWPGEFVSYGSGELREARSVQSALNDLGKVDTRLDQASGTLQLWIR